MNRNHQKNDVNTSKIDTFIRSNLKMLIDTGRLGEVAWMLFLAKALNIQIRLSDVKALQAASSSICALLLCDLEAKGNLSGALDKSGWNKMLNALGLTSEMWLYVYEASLKDWTGKRASFVQEDPHLYELYKRSISFYDENRNITPVVRKLELERQDRAKVRTAFAQGLEEATFHVLREFDLAGLKSDNSPDDDDYIDPFSFDTDDPY